MPGLIYRLVSFSGVRFIALMEFILGAARKKPPATPQWALKLCDSAPEIAREFKTIFPDRLREFSEISPEQRRITAGNSWKVYLLRAYGRHIRGHEAACPITAALCASIPEIRSVLFSVLEPGTEITSHRGPYAGLLRCHIPLIIPRGDCGIRVGKDTYRWQAGVPLVFDDTIEHCAWNRTNDRRVVLFIDYLRPLSGLRNVLNRAVIWLIAHSPFIGRMLKASL